MTDAQRTRLYEAVVAAPDDDAPRIAMADYLDRQGDPWGAFIRTQLALTRALQHGSNEDVSRYRAEAKHLRVQHGNAWTNGVDALVDGCEFSRGFVEQVIVDAPHYLERADELFRLAPIRHVVFSDVGDLLDAILDDPHLNQLASLSLENTSRKHPIGDAGMVAVAASAHLRGLKKLSVPQQAIGMPGLEALCASKKLPSLCYVNLHGNPVDDPVEGFGTDWATGGVDRNGAYLPPLGHDLEAKYGDLPWLHAPSRLRNYPPRMEEL